MYEGCLSTVNTPINHTQTASTPPAYLNCHTLPILKLITIFYYIGSCISSYMRARQSTNCVTLYIPYPRLALHPLPTGIATFCLFVNYY